MIVFAGFNHLDLGETHPNDVWALQLADPAQRIRLWPSGQAPIRPNLDRSRAIYDPVRDRMILFDGLEPGGTCSHQVWSFDLAESTGWQQITTSGSPTYGCWDHSAVYDPVRDRVLCYGGWNASTDVWSLPLTDAAPTWSRLTTGGPTPYNRREHAMIYDPVRDRLLLFAGRDGGSEYFDLWELKLSGTPTWRKLMEHQPELPMPKRGLLNVSMLYDPVGDRLLAFGGRDDAQYDYLNVHYNSVWSLPLAADSLAWEELHPSGSLPSGRELAAAVFDATRNQMVIFGGATTRTQVPSVDVLKLSPPLAVPTHPVKRLTLAPAHPNPSTGNVRLSFQLHATSRVHLAIYDLQGRKIATLAEEVREAGEHSEVWSGRSSTGAMAPTGVYIARLQVGSESIVRRIVRMR
jgi:hypothetical protein